MKTTSRQAAASSNASRRSVRAVVFLLGIVGTALEATPALAQTAANSDNTSLGEIIVTAERRESTVQKTPISMMAISGDDLQNQGVGDLLSLAEITPGMSFRSAGPGQTEFEIRGLSSSGGASPTVGFYLDDIPIAPPALGTIGKVAIDPDLYDLNRVEVLRGPQGTLYGSGSMGGTIKLITNRPELDKLEGSSQVIGSFTDGGGFNRSGNLMLNIPLIPEIVAVRVVVTDKYVAGWIDRTVLNPFPLPINNGCTPTPFYGCARGNVLAAPIAQNFLDVNWERLKNGRISLRFKPSDALDVNLTAMYQKIETGGYSQVDLPPAGLSWPETHYQPFNQPEPYNDEFKSVALNATYNWETLQFTSSSGYWTRDLVQSQDINEAIQATYSLPNFIPGNATNEADSLRQISQEFHLASTGKDPFQWLVGAFYSHLDSAWGQSTLDPALAGFSVGGAAANPAGVVYVSSTNYLFKQSAAFSEVSYELTPKLKLTGGLRYFSYDTDLATTQSGLYAQSANATPTYSEVKATSHGFNPKYNAAYTLTDDAMVYATVAKGFRPGGSNLPLPIIGPNSCLASFQALGLNGSQTSYGSDSVWSYELGEKTKLDSGRIVINGDIYYTKWNSVQQLLPLTCGWWFTANAGDARSYGPELEVTARITSAITLSVNGAYTEAQITTAGAHTNLQAGAPLLNIPKYTANVVASYTTPMTSNWDFTARATEAFTGPMEDIAYYRAGLPAYRMASIRTGMTSDRINVYAFVDNVANKEALLTINNTGIGINMPSLTRATVTQPRTIGIDVHVKF